MSVGYSIISLKQMWYKLNYPVIFWYVKIKYAGNENDVFKYSHCAVKSNAVVFLPHVNYTAKTSMRTYDGELVLQQGLEIIKGVGTVAAEYIEAERIKNGEFKSYDDFYDRCKGRQVTQRVIQILEEQGALEFRESKYLGRTIKYNSSLLSKDL
uniref:Polymerase/primase n=1 Tax=Dulem virus 36 TaxID=3145754 RepID=A0AAU8B112_9CAUD